MTRYWLFDASLEGDIGDELCRYLENQHSKPGSPQEASSRLEHGGSFKKKLPHEEQDSAVWSESFHLARIDFLLKPVGAQTIDVSIRPNTSKRKANDDNAEQSNKIARSGNQKPHQRHSSINGRNMHAPLGDTGSQPSREITFRHISRTEKRDRYTARYDEGKNPRHFEDICLETLDGQRLCQVCIESVSSDDHRIIQAALALTKPPKGSPCKFDVTLVLDRVKDFMGPILRLDLRWKHTRRLSDMNILPKQRGGDYIALFAYILTPESHRTSGSGWKPRVFYENVYTPPHDPNSPASIEVSGLRTGLYAFQSRTLDWLLCREGVHTQASRQNEDASNPSLGGFVPIRDFAGRQCYFNAWMQLCTAERNDMTEVLSQLRGGILAEEMGLGKTVEMLALIQTHTRPISETTVRNELHQVPSTLVVAPKSIIQQWKEEIDTHAPSLAVMMYNGMKAHVGRNQLSDTELIELMHAHDIVLVTYEVLSREVWFATDPPERSRRTERIYERKRSPLVQIDWWRVILDEAQMVESGVTNAAKVAVQLARRNAWAVTGTPLKKDSHDLFGLLTFLRLKPYCLSPSLWNSLLSNFIPIFVELVRTICLRHSKDQVRAELQLPLQKRVVISVPFTAVEEQNYSQLFEEMYTECGLDQGGEPRPDPSNKETAKIMGLMQSWLARLRQICLHPEVGDRNRRALGRREGAPLRTVSDVLQVMCEQNETSLRSEERTKLHSMLRRGQIYEHAKLPRTALKIWEGVETDAAANVDIDRKALRLVEADENTIRNNSEQEEDDASTSRVSQLKSRLRISLELKHTAVFFIANAWFQIKTDGELTKPGSDEYQKMEEQELTKYEEAKQLRRELLGSAARNTSKLIDSIQSRARTRDFVELPTIPDHPIHGGIESRKYSDQLDRIIDTLNKQAEFISQWRENLTKAVCAPLVDQDDTELTGEEYEKSTKEEDQLHAYMEAIRLVVADRGQLLTGQRNLNVRREAANLYRHAIAGEGHAPVLMRELLDQCNILRLGETRDGDIEVCLRGLISQLSQHRGLLDFQGAISKSAERHIVDRFLSHVKPLASEQQKLVAALERELDAFSDVVNARVEYYKQLQAISDLVAPYEEEMTPEEREVRLSRMRDVEAHTQKLVDKFKSRANYLDHLRSDSMAANVERRCIICQDTFETGCLTSCGHVYCKDCILLWWKSHKTCPTCKAVLAKNDMHPITYKPLAVSVQEQSSGYEFTSDNLNVVPENGRTTIYSGIGQDVLDEIKSINLRGSYGTKIDMLTRHLLWIRQKDPGAKAVVFSQFRDFLGVLEHAFSRSRVGWSSIEAGPQGIERFKKDPSIECLLLHAKAQASGLNLVNATHVFICEPLINTAIELQVIARVHRIGQHFPTTVWMYLIEDTVEKAVYEISAERRLAHLDTPHHRNAASPEGKILRNGLAQKKDFEDEIDAANSLEMEEAPTAKLLAVGRSGGEQVAKEDLWPCLFKYRPKVHNPMVTDEAEHVTAAFLAVEAATLRRDLADGGTR